MLDKFLPFHHFPHCSHSLQIFRMYTKNTTKSKMTMGIGHSAATFSSSTPSSTNSQVPANPKMDEFEPDEERLLHEGIPQKMPKIMHEFTQRKRPNCAVYGAGLTSTGALAIPHLVKSPAASHSLINPMRIGKMNVRKIKFVAAGSGFSLFASTRELYGSGLNNFYQISGPKRQNDDGEKISDEQNPFSYHERNEADMWYLQGKRILLPEAVGNIRGISAGRMHSIVYTDQNKVFCFGSNSHGQCAADPLEHPMVTHNRNGMLATVKTLPLDGDEDIVQVHASLDSTFVLTKKGRIFAWGLGTDGQLGNGNGQFQWAPELVKGDLEGEQIRQIGGSTDTLIAVSAKGDLFVWGQNEYGQLGILFPRHVPFKIGKAVMAEATGSSCIVCNSEGHCFTWGSYVLGLGPKVEHLNRPIQLDPPLFASTMKENNKVKRVFASGCSMGALTEAGHLFTWGANKHGSLAIGHRNHQFFPFQVTLSETVKQASIGPDHSLFIADRY